MRTGRVFQKSHSAIMTQPAPAHKLAPYQVVQPRLAAKFSSAPMSQVRAGQIAASLIGSQTDGIQIGMGRIAADKTMTSSADQERYELLEALVEEMRRLAANPAPLESRDEDTWLACVGLLGHLLGDPAMPGYAF